MTCHEVRPLLQIYHDSELDALDAQPISDHLRVCVDCRSTLEAFRRSDALLREAVAEGPGASDVLKHRIRRGRSTMSHALVRTLSIAATIAAIALGGVAVWRLAGNGYDPASDPYRAMAIAEHVRVASTLPGDDGGEDDATEISNLLATTTDGRAQSSAIPGFRVVAGHPCKLGEQTYAHLVYVTPEGRSVSVYFCVAGGDLPEGQESIRTEAGLVEVASQNGETAAIADVGGVRRIAVGDLRDREAIIRAAASIQ